MQTYFNEIADNLHQLTESGEIYLAYLSAEESNFVRFNHNAVRQAGSVKQLLLTISLIHNRRRADALVTLTCELDIDAPACEAALKKLRLTLLEIPEDPYLIYNTSPVSSVNIGQSHLPSDDAMLSEIIGAGAGRDLVGIFASGKMMKGFANSLGQRNWHQVENFNFDWCLYHAADKAVKNNYAGTHWDSQVLRQKMDSAIAALAVLTLPPKTLSPGQYRAYLTPSALNEMMGLLSWGGFGEKSQRNKQSPLMKLQHTGRDGTVNLHPSITLTESAKDGVAPLFNADGFMKTDEVTLIREGKHMGALISPRSAKEFSLATNGANNSEAPESLSMRAGTLKRDEVLATLDTGIFVSNLWYLNYSDRGNCRMTGMTRFATFWVERGEIVAPINVMRFDDSIYRMLGENLIGLTAERDWLLDAGSYGERSSGAAKLPGAVVQDFQLTL